MLNAQQLRFAESGLTSCKLIGNPGCGKTRSIIEYIIDKRIKKVISSSNHFIILTFSKAAQQSFLNKGKQSSYPSLFSNKSIRTIHSMAAYIYDQLFKSKSISLATIILATYRALLNDANTDAVRNMSCLANCKFIIVDEAQDINETQYNLAKQLAEVLLVPLILVGDPNQSIYQFQGGNDKHLMNHSETVHNLTKNYRSTKEIIAFLNEIRPHDTLPLMECANNTSGPKPILFGGTVSEIQEYIISTIRSSQYNYEDIAIIGPIKKSSYNHITFGLTLATQTLHDAGIPFVNYYKDGKDQVSNSDQIRPRSGHVNVLTCHNSKGLEFKLTIVVNYHLNTFTRQPSIRDYDNFKYLWYVGLSRAQEQLIICSIKNRLVFPEIMNVPKELYCIQGNPKMQLLDPKKHLSKTDTFAQINIVDCLSTHEMFDDKRYLEFQDFNMYSSTHSQLYEIHQEQPFAHSEYAMLYGMFAERLFMFYYYQSKDNLVGFVEFLLSQIGSIVFVPKKYVKVYSHIKQRGFVDNKGIININKTISKESDVVDFINYCKSQAKGPWVQTYLYHDAIHYNKAELENMCKQMLTSKDKETQLFQVIRYLYQFECEKKYILSYDFSKELDAFSVYYNPIRSVAQSYESLSFEISVYHQNMPWLAGRIDAINDITGGIIELKFVNDISIKHDLQTILYYNNLYPDWSNKSNIEIINLKSGVCKSVRLTHSITPWIFNIFICKATKQRMVNNVIVCDLETNTIDPFGDPFSPFNTEIIDRHFFEYNLRCPVSTGLVRNNYPITNSEVHGIEESHLNDADDFSDLKNEMNTISEFCRTPTLIAHNGNRFDFKVLEYHEVMPKDIVKVDSIPLINHLTNSRIKSNSLIQQYNAIFNCNCQQLHRAKEDVDLIIDIMDHFELKNTEIRCLQVMN